MREEILSIIQKKFPLSQRPFLDIGNELGLSEDEVIKIIQKEKDNKIIRQTSAIFDTKSLGFKSSLVAFEMKKENIDKAVKIINAHPGVSHNYERDHEFNIWFTIAVDPKSKLGLEKSVAILAELTGAENSIMLPTLKLFKISVKLDTTGRDAKKEKVKKHVKKDIDMTALHLDIIKLIQEDIEIKQEPFAHIINALNIDYPTLFENLNELKEAGVMRRFASILNHRNAGFNANAMTVWDVEEKDGEEIGKKAAAFSAVSHCYLRPKYPNWPYNLFTMIHGKTKEETNGIIADIASEIEHKAKRPLYSTREFKKVRLKYFTPSFLEWEEKHLKDNS
ncbi:MAG TPA: Lrp/AsnC family transcriptional regulator [Campylobacterales bacterium]|nr:Lrp/AsnC family transcriptional regulator [Campylobacterales bacterium]